MSNDRMTEVAFANEIACNTAVRMAAQKNRLQRNVASGSEVLSGARANSETRQV